ncbi:MAG: PIN domain-containing protein [Hyphomonadaceae bacterium]|nr:PIN domain-containing protein [Hyphomonadaceae bacterium]
MVDTGPLVALFDRRDPDHVECRERLKAQSAVLVSTLPVLTEAFHMLRPASHESQQLRMFIGGGGVAVHIPADAEIERAFELMERYSDHPMDFADASVIAAAEALGTRKVFTLDRNDFQTYRIKRGQRHLAVEIV